MLTKIPHGLDEIIATFGDWREKDFEAKYLISFELPYGLIYDGKYRIGRTRAHRLAVPHFQQAFQNIKDAGLVAECFNFGGIYAKRPQRGVAVRPSTHSWGMAVDMEPAKYPLGSDARFSDAVVECWTKAGFFYGGDFKARKDPMHFQLATGY
jgi:hypothetical protein